jgi:predicted polyphosphate/ATP-dependent NAD kinase
MTPDEASHLAPGEPQPAHIAQDAHESPAARRVFIALTKAQTREILGSAAGVGDFSEVISLIAQDPESVAQSVAREWENERMSRSVLQGFRILSYFVRERRELKVIEVTKALQMSQSTAHRYLITLIAVGVLEQNPRARTYRLSQ